MKPCTNRCREADHRPVLATPNRCVSRASAGWTSAEVNFALELSSANRRLRGCFVRALTAFTKAASNRSSAAASATLPGSSARAPRLRPARGAAVARTWLPARRDHSVVTLSCPARHRDQAVPRWLRIPADRSAVRVDLDNARSWLRCRHHTSSSPPWAIREGPRRMEPRVKRVLTKAIGSRPTRARTLCQLPASATANAFAVTDRWQKFTGTHVSRRGDLQISSGQSTAPSSSFTPWTLEGPCQKSGNRTGELVTQLGRMVTFTNVSLRGRCQFRLRDLEAVPALQGPRASHHRLPRSTSSAATRRALRGTSWRST